MELDVCVPQADRPVGEAAAVGTDGRRRPGRRGGHRQRRFGHRQRRHLHGAVLPAVMMAKKEKRPENTRTPSNGGKMKQQNKRRRFSFLFRHEFVEHNIEHTHTHTHTQTHTQSTETKTKRIKIKIKER